MSKNNATYKIEDDLDFYNELQKILNSESSENTIIQNNNFENICLLSYEKLEPNHVTLDCKHTFNYLPIYQEVMNQKNKNTNKDPFFNIQYEVTKLSENQIKCPYCRSITNKILPFIQYKGVKRCKGVNYPPDLCMSTCKCTYTNDKNKLKPITCNMNALFYPEENLLLCQNHFKMHQNNKNKNQESKEELDNKCNKKEDINIQCCTAILKTGKNIGSQCQAMAMNGEQFCKRHIKTKVTSISLSI